MNDVAIGRTQRVLSASTPEDGPGSGIPSAVTEPSVGCLLSLAADGTILGAGPTTRAVLGWSPEDLTGSHVSVLTRRLGGDLDEAQLAALLADDDTATLIDVGVRRDGSTFRASVSLTAERGATGEIAGVHAVVRDVTAALEARRLARRTQDAVVVVDADFTVREATPAAAQMLGSEPAEIVARPGTELIHPADHAAVIEVVDRLLADPRRVEQLVARLRGGDRRWRWVEGTVSNLLADPEIGGLVATLRDVTDQIRTRDALRLSGALHQAMVETAEDGIVVVGEDGTTRYANPAMSRLLGVPAEALYGADPLALLGAAPRPGGGGWRQEVGYAHPEGSERILTVTRSPLHRDDTVDGGSLFTVSDVTESRRSELALRRRALYDPLTGLPNRYLVRDRLEMAAARQSRSDSGTAVLFLDLDRFKTVNDTYGHDAGDELLRQVAGRLMGAVRASDTVGRHGGDEFVVICEELDEAAARTVAVRIQEALRQPFDLPCARVEIGASIGIALSPPYPVDQLVEQADAAMYRAKRDGGGGAALARPEQY